MIKTGICSYGMSGKVFHAPFLQSHPGFELAAIVERHKEESKEKYPDAVLYRSAEEMMKDDALQLIVVNTPVQTHYEYAKAALLAGKHVVVEKPFTVTSKEGEELGAIAKDKGLHLIVYQNRRYDGDFLAVKNVLDKKLLGDIKEVEIRFDRFRPALSGKRHKEDDLPGSGNLYDLGPHLIDQALQLFGWPEKIFGDVWTMRPGIPSDDFFEVLLYYPTMRVRLKSTVFAKQSYYAYIIHGSTGSFLQQRSDRQEQQLIAGKIPTIESWCERPPQPDGLLNTITDGKELVEETTSAAGNYMGFYEDVLQVLTGKMPNPIPAADGIKTIQLIELAKQSAREGKVITINM